MNAVLVTRLIVTRHGRASRLLKMVYRTAKKEEYTLVKPRCKRETFHETIDQ